MFGKALSPALRLLRLICSIALGLALLSGANAASSGPGKIWPHALSNTPRSLQLLAFNTDDGQLHLLQLPYTEGYAGIQVLPLTYTAASLSLNEDALHSALTASGSDHDAVAAQMLFLLSDADLVLSLSESTWRLWRMNNSGLSADLIYSQGGASLSASSLNAFLAAALGYDAQVMATQDSDYLLRINSGNSPDTSSVAFGIAASSQLMRVPMTSQHVGLGLLRLVRAEPGWAVYRLMSSETPAPWPIGTKLLLSDSELTPAESQSPSEK